MKKRLLVAIAFFLIFNFSYAQEKDSVDRMVQELFLGAQKIETPQPCWESTDVPQEYVINEVAITDTFLSEQIKQFTHEMEQVDSIFQSGLGYFKLHIHDTDGDTNVIQYFRLNPSTDFDIPQESKDVLFPHAYAWVGKRLVYIYYEALSELICFRFSEKSKRHMRKITEPFLLPGTKMVFRDEKGRRDPRIFRENVLYLHKGKYIYYFLDKPPQVYLSLYSPVKQLKPEWQQPGVIRQQ